MVWCNSRIRRSDPDTGVMLSRKELLGKATVKRGEVMISTGVVGIREMNGAERDQYLAMMTESHFEIPAGLQAKLVRWCVIDENGDSLFTEDDDEHINQMGGQDLQAIVLAVMGLSGLTEDSVEELEGNSPGELSAVPGSSSPKQSVAQ